MSAAVAVLTPPGKAALATLGVRGPGAWDAVRGLFRPRSGAGLPASPEPGRLWLGAFGRDVADEVVLTVPPAGAGAWVELHCHGGPAVLDLLLDLLRQHGCTAEGWAEHLAGREPRPLASRVAEALAHAPTLRTAAILLDQHHGALRNALIQIGQDLHAGGDAGALAGLEALAARSALGRHLVEPWHVVVAGPPNAGKSSLVNAVAGYQRSIVSALPGTTRDVVTARLAVDGWPVDLTDTAGLRETAEELEGAGIARARTALATADLVLWLADASDPAGAPPAATAPGAGARFQVVINKTDLPPAWDLDAYPGSWRVSALTGEGIAELLEGVSRALVPQQPAPGEPVPFTGALADAALAAREALRAGDRVRAWQVLEPLLIG